METDPDLLFGCGFCRKLFPSRQELRSHKSKEHADFLIQINEDPQNLFEIIQRIKSEEHPNTLRTESDNILHSEEGSVPGAIQIQNGPPSANSTESEKLVESSGPPVKPIIGVDAINRNGSDSGDNAVSMTPNIGTTTLYNQNVINRNIYIPARDEAGNTNNASSSSLVSQTEDNGQNTTGISAGQEGPNRNSNSTFNTNGPVRATVIVSSAALSNHTEKAPSPVPTTSKSKNEPPVVPAPVKPVKTRAFQKMSSSGRVIKAVKRFGASPEPEPVSRAVKRASLEAFFQTVISPSPSSSHCSNEDELSTEWAVPAFRYRGKAKTSAKQPDTKRIEPSPSCTISSPSTVKISKNILGARRPSLPAGNQINRRTPRTRLPTDRVLFTTSIIEDSLRSLPIVPKPVLHVDNVSNLPVEICYRGIPNPHQIPRSEELHFDRLSAPSHRKKKTCLVWPGNKSIIPSVVIPDLNVEEIRIWSQRNDHCTIRNEPKLDDSRQDDLNSGDVPNQTSKDSSNISVADILSNSKYVGIPLCDRCGFIAKSIRGLSNHMKRSHSELKVPFPIDGIKKDDCPLPPSAKASSSTCFEPLAMETLSTSAFETKLEVSGQDDSKMELEPQEDSNSDLDSYETTSEYADRGVPGGKKRKICLFCPFVAKKHWGYIFHMRAIHTELCDSPTGGSGGKVTQMECPVCHKIFPYVTSEEKSFFIQHVEIHRGLRPFVCPHCERGFRDPIRLITHTTTQHFDQL